MPSIPENIGVPVYSTAREWREREGRYRLQGIVCKDCGAKVFPKTPICPHCRSKNIEITEFKQTGRLVTDPASSTFPLGAFHKNMVPFHMAMVELDDGPCVMAEIVHCPHPMDHKAGARVSMAFRKLKREEIGTYLYGFKFRIDRQ